MEIERHDMAVVDEKVLPGADSRIDTDMVHRGDRAYVDAEESRDLIERVAALDREFLLAADDRVAHWLVEHGIGGLRRAGADEATRKYRGAQPKKLKFLHCP